MHEHEFRTIESGCLNSQFHFASFWLLRGDLFDSQHFRSTELMKAHYLGHFFSFLVAFAIGTPNLAGHGGTIGQPGTAAP
jgi:hypothetical protein